MLKGTDLAYCNTKVNYSRMKQAGILFAYLKIGQGTTITDPMFPTHKMGCIENQITWGIYYFADYRYPAKPQAQRFVNLVGDNWGNLPPALDIEYEERLGWPRPAGNKMIAWILDFIQEFKKLTRKELILYTNPDLLHEVKKYTIPPEILSIKLWLAHYTTEPYIDNEPFPNWLFWQQAGDVRADWAGNGVDVDWFNGDVDDLQKLFIKPQPQYQIWLPMVQK